MWLGLVLLHLLDRKELPETDPASESVGYTALNCRANTLSGRELMLESAARAAATCCGVAFNGSASDHESRRRCSSLRIEEKKQSTKNSKS